MPKPLLTLLSLSILIAFTCCRSSSGKSKDDPVHSRALLFDSALQLEKDSATVAIAIYKRLSQGKTDDFYATEAMNRLHYLVTRKFLETIRIANTDSIGRQKYFSQFPGYSVDSFLDQFSKRHFSIYNADADGPQEQEYTTGELKKELTQRSGPAFTVIAQMGYFYSIQCPTYPDAGFPVYTEYRTNSYVAVVANCRLTFLFDDNGGYQLRRIESYYLTDK